MSRLKTPKAPALPTPEQEYRKESFGAFYNILRLYFNQLDSFFSTFLSTRGGQYLNLPYGAFLNTATQAVTAANTPYVIIFNTTDKSNGITLATNRMTVTQAGTYNVHYCLQFENTATSITDVWVWMRRNGTDVPASGSTWSVTSSHAGINGYMLGTANFFIDMATNDYIELVIAADATGLNIEAYGSSVSPFTRPSIPSSVVTVSFVSGAA